MPLEIALETRDLQVAVTGQFVWHA